MSLGSMIKSFCCFEDECTQSHTSAGRVMEVIVHIVIVIVDLLNKYRDAHISHSVSLPIILVDPTDSTWYMEGSKENTNI